MKQLYFTSCRPHEGLQGRAGLQVRAMSADAGQSIIQTAPKFCYYHLPFGDEYRPDIVSPEDAPIRFAFLVTPELGPIALQAVYYGIDPASGRPGNPFVHLLFDDDHHDLDAYKVLASWQAPFWQTEAAQDDGSLDDVEALGHSDNMDEALLVECAQQDDGWLDHVAFLLNAFLQIEPARQIFIVGEPRDIVGMLFALIRLVPTQWRHTITFSTYEKQTDGHDLRFVGTTWGTTSPERDLPDYCYSGRAVALNLKTGRRSPEINHLSYTNFALEQLAAGALSEQVDPFLHLCQLADLGQPVEMEAVFQSYDAVGDDGVALSQPILQTICQYPPLTAHAFQSEGFQRRLLEAIETNPSITAGLEQHLSAYFSEDQQASVVLTESFCAQVLRHVYDGAVHQLDVLIRHVLPLIPESTQCLQRLFQELSDKTTHPPKTISVDVRAYLLQVWQEVVELTHNPERLNRWLTISSADELEAMLDQLKSPTLRATTFSLNLVAGVRPNERTLRALMDKPAFIAGYLHSVAGDRPEFASEIALLFAQVAPNGYLLQLLDTVRDEPSAWMAPFLTTITGSEQAPFLHQHGPRLLKVMGHEPAFSHFLTTFEADHQELIGQTPPLLTFYGACVEQNILQEASLRKRIQAWQYLDLLEAPELESQKARDIRKHMANLQSAITAEGRQVLEHKLLKLLAEACALPSPRVDVEKAVFVLGPAFMSFAIPLKSASSRAVWEGLCKLALEDKDLLSHDIFTKELIKVRAGAIRDYPDRKRLMLEWTNLSPAGIELLQRLPKKIRHTLRQDKTQWPRESQKVWDNWETIYGRKGVLGRMKTLFHRK